MTIADVKRRILVTGGGGLIGSRLVKALLNTKCRVKVLDVSRGRLSRVTHRNLEFLGVGADDRHGGMADKALVDQAVEDVDVIYHLAINWNGGTWRHNLPLADLFTANIQGTLNLLDAAVSHRVRHFLFASSCAVYGATDSQVVREDVVCRPELWGGDPGAAYGIVKLVTERLCLLYYHIHKLPVTVLRIDVVFTDDDALPSSTFIDNTLKDLPVDVMEGKGFTSIHIDDVVDAFVLATLNEEAYGEVFNLSNPDTYMTDREAYELLITLTGSRTTIQAAANPLRLGPPALSIEHIQERLGWRPRKGKEALRTAIANMMRKLMR